MPSLNLALNKSSLSPKQVAVKRPAPKAASRGNQELVHYIKQLELENNHLKNLMLQRGVMTAPSSQLEQQPPQLTNQRSSKHDLREEAAAYQQMKNLSYLQRASAGPAV